MVNRESVVIEKLEQIRELLNTFVSLYKAINAKDVERVKVEILKTTIRRKIYDLCDGTRTVSQIAETVDPTKPLSKIQPLVSYHLGTLERSGFISHRDERGQRFYYRTLE